MADIKAEYIDLCHAYAAGFLEADGCVQLTGLRITNRCPAVLEWFKTNFGGEISKKGQPINCYDWNLHGEAAERLAEKLLPFLLFKQEQVVIFLAYRKTIKKRGSRFTQQELSYRERLKTLLKKEKAQWRE